MEISRAVPRNWHKHRGVLEAGKPFRSKKHRPPYWLSRVEHLVQVARQEMVEAGEEHRIRDVTFRVVDNVAVNASAFAAGEEGLVLMNSGLFAMMQKMIERAVRNPEFLSEYLPIDESRDAEQFSFDCVAKIPEALDQRSLWGLSFFSRMADFVIHHELAHVVRSHHQLLLLRPGASLAIDEVLAMSARGQAGHRRRMLEFDADAIALDLMLIEASASPEAPLGSWNAGQTEDEVFNTLLAVILLCQLIDRSGREMAHYGISSHPAPVLRAIRFSEVTHATFEGLGALDSGKLFDIVDKAWWEASRVAMAERFRRGRWFGDDMRDVPPDLIDSCRMDHVAFVDEFEEILSGGAP